MIKIAVLTVSIDDKDADKIEAIEQIRTDLANVAAAFADEWTQHSILTAWSIEYCRDRLIDDPLVLDYLESDGISCPFCKSFDIQGGRFDFDGGYAWQEVSCYCCGADWCDEYTLIGASLPDRPE